MEAEAMADTLKHSHLESEKTIEIQQNTPSMNFASYDSLAKSKSIKSPQVQGSFKSQEDQSVIMRKKKENSQSKHVNSPKEKNTLD